jgi:hypothetical protein
MASMMVRPVTPVISLMTMVETSLDDGSPCGA